MTIIRYHWNYPSSQDPYYLFNPSENMSRISYYHSNYTPHLFIDGIVDGGYTPGSWEGMIDNRSFIDAPMIMNIWGTFMRDSLAGYVTVQVITESNPGLNNYKLRVGLLESGIHWRAPNGTQYHNQTFRDMIPSSGGQAITPVEGDTLEYTFRYTTQSPIAPDSCFLVAFVQADNNREICQGVRIAIPELTPVSVKDGVLVPDILTLSQNYPNPFNAQTRIEFATVGGNINLEVYDITGGLVKTLVDGSLSAGAHSVVWDGTDNFGKATASGVYFYRLHDGASSQVKRMALLK